MWVDIIFFAILAIFVIIGIVKGLFDSLLGLISTGVALAIAILVAKPATSFLSKFKVDGMFYKMLDKMEDGEVVHLFGNPALEFTKDGIANFLTDIFSIIVVFILIKLAIWLLSKLFSSVVEKSTIGSGLNKVLGGLFGLIKGGVIVVALLAVLSAVSGTKLVGDKIQVMMDKSKVTNYVYKYVSDYTEKGLEKADIQDFIGDLIASGEKTAEEAKSK